MTIAVHLRDSDISRVCWCVISSDHPRVLDMPERLYLPRGMMGTITCPVDSNPPLTVIVWSKDTKIIDFRLVRNVRMNKAGTLLIDPVTAVDEGQYTCTPYSPLGAGQPSTVIHVYIRGTSLSQSISRRVSKVFRRTTSQCCLPLLDEVKEMGNDGVNIEGVNIEGVNIASDQNACV